MPRSRVASLWQAFTYVKTRRKIAEPNEGFTQQLIDFDVQLFGQPSIQLSEFEYSPED